MICPNCEGTGEILEMCCNGRDCACKGEAQYKEECEKCGGTGEVE